MTDNPNDEEINHICGQYLISYSPRKEKDIMIDNPNDEKFNHICGQYLIFSFLGKEKDIMIDNPKYEDIENDNTKGLRG